MNAAYIHLFFNHFPVVGIPLVLLLFLISYLKKSQAIFISGCWLLLIVSLTAIPTYWAGAPAEEIVEHLPYFDKEIQETHQAWGQYALMATLFSGFLGLVSLFYDSFKKRLSKSVIVVTVLWLLVNIVILFITAGYGSRILHQEIREQIKSSE